MVYNSISLVTAYIVDTSVVVRVSGLFRGCLILCSVHKSQEYSYDYRRYKKPYQGSHGHSVLATPKRGAASTQPNAQKVAITNLESN